MTEVPAPAGGPEPIELSDFTANRRMVAVAAIAIGLGIVATYVAAALLQLIALFTNLFYTQRLSFAPASPADHTRGLARVAVPVVGKIALHDLLKARIRHLEDEQRRERILPFEYLLPRWLRPGRAVVRDRQ